MATFNAATYLKGIKLRPSAQYGPEEATFSITVPGSLESGANADGTAGPVVTLASGDVFNFGKLGPNVRVLSVEFDTSPIAATSALVSVGTSASATNFISGGTTTAAIPLLVATQGDTDNGFSAIFAPSTSTLDLKATLGTVTGVQTTTGTLDRTLNLRVKYQYAYPNLTTVGVTNSTYPLAGAIKYNAAINQTYNGNAP